MRHCSQQGLAKGSLASSSLQSIISYPKSIFRLRTKVSIFLLLVLSQKNASVGTDGPVSASPCDIDVSLERRRRVSWVQK